MVQGTFHSGITVSDLDRSLAFYRDALGLEVLWRRRYDEDYILRMTDVEGADAIDAALVRVPGDGHLIELLEYQGCERHSAASRPCDPACGHVAFVVDDIHAWHERLAAQGVRFRGDGPQEITAGANRGGYGLYAADPDGFIVEFHQRPR
jgi:catechol 2,3-dioxygenase-like lactoylglutathione lyase family enzyme